MLELLLLLLLLVVELHYVFVHSLDFFSLCGYNFFVVLLDCVVVHLGVALVTNSVQLLVLYRKLAFVFRTHFAD